MSGYIDIQTHEIVGKNCYYTLARVVGDYTSAKLVIKSADGGANPTVNPLKRNIEYWRGEGDLVVSSLAWTGGEGLVGPVVMDGVAYKDFTPPTSGYGKVGRGTEALGIRADGSSKIYSSFDGDSAASMVADGVVHGFGFAGAPVIDGVPQDLDGSGKYKSLYFPSGRQVIGMSHDNKPMVLSTWGHSNYDGLFLNELAFLCADVGFKNCMNMDGGGSAQGAYQGRVYHSSSDLSKRRGLGAVFVVNVDEGKAGV